MFFIFLISSMSNPPQPIPPHYDLNLVTLVEHVIEFMLLGFLLSMALKQGVGRISNKVILAAVLISSCYGVTDEIHQFFVPGRIASIYDVIADIIGSCIGAALRARID